MGGPSRGQAHRAVDEPSTAKPPQPEQPPELLLSPSDATELLDRFAMFLTVAIHTLLYTRGLYPKETFLCTRHYNLAVQQSRHPGVCRWVTNAVGAVASRLQEGEVQRLAFVIYRGTQVLERWIFDVERFPGRGGWFGLGRGKRGRDKTGRGNPPASRRTDKPDPSSEGAGSATERGEPLEKDGRVNWTNVDESFRGALRRLDLASSTRDKLPAECTFTLAIELRDEKKAAPIGHDSPWIPSQPDLQPATKDGFTGDGSALGGADTAAIRAVQAGPLFFECWVETGKDWPGDDEAPNETDDDFETRWKVTPPDKETQSDKTSSRDESGVGAGGYPERYPVGRY